MPYIIDGHNLIPKTGIQLTDADDEDKLIRLLQEFARLKRTKVDVYFDGAPPGMAGLRKYGSVTAHFVRQGTTADNAIQNRVQKLAKAAQNWIVVSNDHAVQHSVISLRAQVLSAEDFLRDLQKLRNRASIQGERKIPEGEIDEWLKAFGGE